MLKIKSELLEPKGEAEQTVNFNKLFDRIALAEGKINFFNKLPLKVINHPGEVYYYGGNVNIPVLTGSETLALEKYTADTTYDYTIKLGGVAAKMSDATKAALYGAGADQTHAVVMLMQLPTNDPTEVAYNGTALTAADTVVIDGITYWTHVQGLYDNSGTVTTATTNFTLTYNGATYKCVWDITEIELAGEK